MRFDGYSPGTIVVRTSERRLYLRVGVGTALRYPVGVGKKRQGLGRHRSHRRQVSQPGLVAAARSAPRQAGPARRHPGGSPSNPMGVAALTLTGGEYAIHGTNVPRSIGGYVSYGCIRMHNKDISDLYNRVMSERGWW